MSVISILGNTSPRIGTATKYVAITPYANILRNSIATSQENILWDIYVLENGKWRKTQGNSKKGKEVEYTFTQRSLLRKGIKLVVNIDGKTGELLIKPMPALAPKILKVELLDGNYQKINRTIGYNDKIYAKAYCADLDGQKIDFYLWEDDVIGSGHHKDNEINKVKHVKSIVHKGIAIAEFNLFYYSSYATTIANIQNPKGQKSEGDTHEYYVTAEYNHKKTASGNVNMRKPLVNHQIENTYTKSIKNNVVKKDIQGKIIKVSFVDKHKKSVYTLQYSDKIMAKIETVDLINHPITISIYEKDPIFDDLIWQNKFIVKENTIYIEVPITNEMWKKANDGGDNIQQEYFIHIEYNNSTIKSNPIEIQKNIPTTPLQKGKSKSKIGANKNHNKNNTCPNCNKNITLEEIKKICVNAEGICSIENTSMIEKALPYLNQYRQKVGIRTCLAKTHFLAQISQESKFFQLQEKFKYSSAERMRGIFPSYFRQFGSVENQKKEANRLSQLSLDSKNWQEVANAIYGKKHPNGAKHTEEDDGWRYSGKGFKQITWKDNYEDLQKYTKDTLGVEVNWVGGNNPYKLKENPKDAIISALAFWGSKKLSNLATGTTDKDIENVTYIINEKGEGLQERIRYFRKAEKVLKLNECTAISENKQENNDKGTVVVVSGISKSLGKEGDKKWPIYPVYVYRNLSLGNYKKLKKEKKLPKPNFTTYLARDAANNSQRSTKRYGSHNECPPGEYYLNKGAKGQKYHIYISDKEGIGDASINGSDGWRGGIAIHGGWPSGAEGCLTTHTKNVGNKKKGQTMNSIVKELIENIPDFENNNDDRPVRIIIEERKVEQTSDNWLGKTE